MSDHFTTLQIKGLNTLSRDTMSRKRNLFSDNNTAWELPQILSFTWTAKLVASVF